MSGSIVGLITARGGSKTIPRKNVMPVGGQPLIAWTIQAALESRLDGLIVSTDDAEIAAVSREWGGEVPFTRPAELAGDASPHIDVVVHAAQWLVDNRQPSPDYIMLLQPTSPLRSAQDIDAALDLARTGDAPAVVSVTSVEQHPYLMKEKDEAGRLKDFMPSDIGYLRRQALPPLYAPNGAIYLVRTEIILEQKTFWPEGTIGYEMPPERSLDVDTPWDLELVRLVMENQPWRIGDGEAP